MLNESHFWSLQDTCVALQALSKYASEVYSNMTSLTVQFGEKDDQQFSETFNITDNNRLVTQRAEVGYQTVVVILYHSFGLTLRRLTGIYVSFIGSLKKIVTFLFTAAINWPGKTNQSKSILSYSSRNVILQLH